MKRKKVAISGGRLQTKEVPVREDDNQLHPLDETSNTDRWRYKGLPILYSFPVTETAARMVASGSSFK